MEKTFALVAGIASILGFMLGVATTRWGRNVLKDLARGLTVPFLGIRLVRMGVYDFFDSRTTLTHRRKTTHAFEYLSPAVKEVGIIALSLNYSIMHQNLHDELRKLLKTRNELKIYVFLLDPASPLVETVAAASARTPGELREYINQSWTRLSRMAATLDYSEQQRFHLHQYNTYIANSVLVVDPYEKDGRITVENYLYKVPIDGRYSFECKRPGSPMFEKVRAAYERFKEDFAGQANMQLQATGGPHAQRMHPTAQKPQGA
jgi:hypothetical protein